MTKVRLDKKNGGVAVLAPVFLSRGVCSFSLPHATRGARGATHLSFSLSLAAPRPPSLTRHAHTATPTHPPTQPDLMLKMAEAAIPEKVFPDLPQASEKGGGERKREKESGEARARTPGPRAVVCSPSLTSSAPSPPSLPPPFPTPAEGQRVRDLQDHHHSQGALKNEAGENASARESTNWGSAAAPPLPTHPPTHHPVPPLLPPPPSSPSFPQVVPDFRQIEKDIINKAEIAKPDVELPKEIPEPHMEKKLDSVLVALKTASVKALANSKPNKFYNLDPQITNRELTKRDRARA